MSQSTNKMRLDCPHCSHRLRIRWSTRITELYRTGTVECQNIHCGWRGTMAFQVINTLTESFQPNPAVSIPFSSYRRPEPAEDAPSDTDQPADPTA